MSQWYTVHHFASKPSADLVCQKLKQIIRAANVSVQLKDDLSESDQKRGVGKWAICFEVNKTPSYIISGRMSAACNAALQLALADELAKSNPNHHLLSTWHLNENNRENYCKFDFSDLIN